MKFLLKHKKKKTYCQFPAFCWAWFQYKPPHYLLFFIISHPRVHSNPFFSIFSSILSTTYLMISFLLSLLHAFVVGTLLLSILFTHQYHFSLDLSTFINTRCSSSCFCFHLLPLSPMCPLYMLIQVHNAFYTTSFILLRHIITPD